MRHLLYASTIGVRCRAGSLTKLPRHVLNLPRQQPRSRFVGVASSSSTTGDSSPTEAADGERDAPQPPRSPSAWRRDQLSRLEHKFSRGTDEDGEGDEGEEDGDDGPLEIRSDDELQQVWRDMESRVTRRRSLTREERGPGKFGRRNIKRTDEEAWLAAGLYGDDGAEGEGDGKAQDGDK